MNAQETRALHLGFIGFGNMGRALAMGVRQHPELADAFPLLVHDLQAASLKAARDAGLEIAPDPRTLAERADVILLAVKPDQIPAVLRDIAPAVTGDKVVLSIAAGVTIRTLSEALGGACPVVRVMPNTPALVGEGIFGLCMGKDVPESIQERLRALFTTLGTTVELPESKFNAFTGLSGSGPAYVWHFLDSLAEAGVSVGLDRASSRRIALQLLRGAAVMAERTGLPAAELREQVCSPGGTSIAGLNVLDRNGVRGHLIDAVIAATRRGREMESE